MIISIFEISHIRANAAGPGFFRSCQPGAFLVAASAYPTGSSRIQPSPLRFRFRPSAYGPIPTKENPHG